ncbi:MAG TPA: hypothetical protein VHU87_10295 [Rhizomicrobium sp.]|jgi:hypothetical protein|nr:hypothetical protein [Rhizomicrobium sp.]
MNIGEPLPSLGQEEDMPRYYFHIREGGNLVEDEEGAEVPDLEAAKSEARASARDLAIDEIRNERRVNGRVIEVADGYGKTLATIAIRDVVG